MRCCMPAYVTASQRVEPVGRMKSSQSGCVQGTPELTVPEEYTMAPCTILLARCRVQR